jgi:hypothetical protein
MSPFLSKSHQAHKSARKSWDFVVEHLRVALRYSCQTKIKCEKLKQNLQRKQFFLLSRPVKKVNRCTSLRTKIHSVSVVSSTLTNSRFSKENSFDPKSIKCCFLKLAHVLRIENILSVENVCKITSKEADTNKFFSDQNYPAFFSVFGILTF